MQTEPGRESSSAALSLPTSRPDPPRSPGARRRGGGSQEPGSFSPSLTRFARPAGLSAAGSELRGRRAGGGGSRRGRSAASSLRARGRPWARGAGRGPPAPAAEGGGGGRRPGDGGGRGGTPPPRPPGSNFAANSRPRGPRGRPASPGRASNLMHQRQPEPAAPPAPGLPAPPRQPGLPAASRCRRSPWPRRARLPRRPGRRRQRGMRRPRAP